MQRGKQVEYICTADIGEMIGAQGYVRMLMEKY